MAAVACKDGKHYWSLFHAERPLEQIVWIGPHDNERAAIEAVMEDLKEIGITFEEEND